MTAEEREAIISFLKKDEIKNINMLNFMESYPVMSLERIGNSVLLRGVSDCQWVYVSSPDEGELKDVAERLTQGDSAFAAMEEWMLPVLFPGRAFSWELSMTRFVLPDHVTFPKAPAVFSHSGVTRRCRVHVRAFNISNGDETRLHPGAHSGWPQRRYPCIGKARGMAHDPG